MVRCPFHWQISHGVEFLCECNAILSLVLPILMVMIMIMMKTQNIAFCQASQCMIWSAAILSLVLLFLFFVSYRSPSLVIRIKLFHLKPSKLWIQWFQWQRTQCDDDDYEGDDKVIFHLLLFLVLLTASIPHHLKPCWWWYVWWCWCIVININDDVGMMMVITSALALALSGDEM